MLTLYNRQLQLPPSEPIEAPPEPKPRAGFDLQLALTQAKEGDRRYTLSRTSLGDFSLSWAELWWTGLFSIVDIATYLPGSRFIHPTDYHETVYVGEGPSPFSTTDWETNGGYRQSYDIYTGQQPPTPFSEDPVLPYHGRGPVSRVLVGDHVDAHQSKEVARWKKHRRRLPFWRQPLALPAARAGPDLDNDHGPNVTYVVMK